MPTFHVVLECEGVPSAGSETILADISDEFSNRPWHQNVICKWRGPTLCLEADNDYDENGLALMDEFSDVLIICLEDPGDAEMRVVSVSAR